MASKSVVRVLWASAMIALGCASSSGGSGQTGCSSSGGACAAGGSVQSCMTTDAQGGCASASFVVGSRTFACASCVDCAAAAESAAQACGAGGGFDAGGILEGGGLPDVTIGVDSGAPDSSPGVDDSAVAQDTAAPDRGIDGGMEAGDVCGSTPTLHPETVPGVYCPFMQGGVAGTCPAGQECCEAPPGGASTCQAAGVACPVLGSTVWACEDTTDCTSGAVCCGTGTVQLDPTCSFYRGTGFKGSHCAASCVAGEVEICESSTECGGGASCVPFKTQGVALGTCM